MCHSWQHLRSELTTSIIINLKCGVLVHTCLNRSNCYSVFILGYLFSIRKLQMIQRQLILQFQQYHLLLIWNVYEHHFLWQGTNGTVHKTYTIQPKHSSILTHLGLVCIISHSSFELYSSGIVLNPVFTFNNDIIHQRIWFTSDSSSFDLKPTCIIYIYFHFASSTGTFHLGVLHMLYYLVLQSIHDS